jgi:hypothetical protein
LESPAWEDQELLVKVTLTSTKECVVYWLHLPTHTDPFCEGYIGVTTNFNKRMKSHKNTPVNNYMSNVISKYGWEYLCSDILHTGDENQCYAIEASYRNSFNIGWNLQAGGQNGRGGALGFKHSKETIEKHKQDAFNQHKNNPELAKQLAQYNSNVKSKSYLITYPDGQLEIIKNMRAFCREHKLSQSNMISVVKGRCQTCKGFKAKAIND